jgi:hypothetical protein
MAKVYYLEEKMKDAKITSARFVKQKKELYEKMNLGIRSYDHLEAYYARFAG